MLSNRFVDTRYKPSVVGCGELLRLKYASGGVVKEQLLTGAIAVMRGDARVIDQWKKDIPTKTVVVCRRISGQEPHLSIGAALEVVDPGEENQFLVLLKGSVAAPVVAKSQCRPAGACKDADASCGKCCNNQKNKKK